MEEETEKTRIPVSSRMLPGGMTIKRMKSQPAGVSRAIYIKGNGVEDNNRIHNYLCIPSNKICFQVLYVLWKYLKVILQFLPFL